MKVASCTDDDTVIRLMNERGIALSPDPDDPRPRRPGFLSAIHPEPPGKVIVFIRFINHDNPADNGFAAYSFEEEGSSDNALKEAAALLFRLKDGLLLPVTA